MNLKKAVWQFMLANVLAYGKYRYKTFRIPHMGNIYMDDLIEYLQIFESNIC